MWSRGAFGWSRQAVDDVCAVAGSDTLTSKSVQAVSTHCTCQRQLFSDRSACDAPRSPDIDHPSICRMFPAGHQPHNSAKQVLACGVHAAQGMSSATCRGTTHLPVTRSWTWRAVGQAVAKYGSWSLASVLVKHLSGAWTGQTRLKVVSTPITVITFGWVTQESQRHLSDLVTDGVQQARRQGISARPLRVAVEGAPVDSQADAFVLAWTSCEGGALGWTVPMTPPPE